MVELSQLPLMERMCCDDGESLNKKSQQHLNSNRLNFI
jgi:hypothetical protein